MGIALSGLEALLDLHRRFGDFGRTVQIGRQGLFIADQERSRADELIRLNGLGDGLADIVGDDHYADERLLPLLGANPICAADASDYESAAIIHDFNEPISEQYYGLFDTLIDYGSLEHIFNVPVALANMMRMVKVGGRIISLHPSNNWLGHGFYQIGPELPFRVYQPYNGFEIISVKLVVLGQAPVELADRGAEGFRNEIGFTPNVTDLIAVARKTSDVAPFSRWPQQGDYSHQWQLHASETA